MIGIAHIGTAGHDPVVVGLVAGLAVVSLFFTIFWATLPRETGDIAITTFLGILTAILIAGVGIFLFVSPHKALVLDKGKQEVFTTVEAGQKVCTVDTLEFRCDIKQVGKNKYEVWGKE